MGHRERLTSLLDIGVIDELVRPLMSGKEAEVFLVVVQGERRVAKLYKEATSRSFKHRAEYTEGRRTKNTRQQRAMSRRSKYGREQEEAAWRSAEVDAIYRLQAAGVRVPEPHDFVDGILIMELIADEHGEPAPRLVDVTLTKDEAEATHKQLMREITRMLCAGLVHGDLSDFNVLMTPEGPVVIDFPQAVDAATNNNARKMLQRDVRNVTSFLARFSPRLSKTKYAEEMWGLYEAGKLEPDTELTGKWNKEKKNVDLMGILDEIYAAEVEERRRRDALGLEPLPDKRPPPKGPKKGRGRRGGGDDGGGDASGGQRGRGDERRDDRGDASGGQRGRGDERRDDRGPRSEARDGGRGRRQDGGGRGDDRGPRRDDRGPRRDGGGRGDDRGPRRDDRGPRRDGGGRGDDRGPRRDDRGPRDDRRPDLRGSGGGNGGRPDLRGPSADFERRGPRRDDGPGGARGGENGRDAAPGRQRRRHPEGFEPERTRGGGPPRRREVVLTPQGGGGQGGGSKNSGAAKRRRRRRRRGRRDAGESGGDSS